MSKIESSIIINASEERVWQTLTDFKEYPKWNPFIRSIKGSLEKNGKLEVKIQPDGMKPQVFKPTIIELSTNKALRWIGHLFIKGLFDGEHYFILQPINGASTKLIHGENFKGLLSGLIMKKIGEQTLQGFKEMNLALKKQAELQQVNIA